LRDRKGKSARIAEKIKKKIGVDVSVKPVEPKEKVVEVAKQETPKVETKDDKSANEKK
jgi:large subunit ribosomal protein L19